MKKLLLSLSLLLSTAAYAGETDHTQIQKTLEELQASVAKMTDKVEHVNTKSDLLQKGIETTTGHLTQVLTQITQILDNIAHLKQNHSEHTVTPPSEPTPAPTQQEQTPTVTTPEPAPVVTPVATSELPAAPTPAEQNQAVAAAPLPTVEPSEEMPQQQFIQEQSEEAQAQQETTAAEQQPEEIIDEEPTVL